MKKNLKGAGTYMCPLWDKLKDINQNPKWAEEIQDSKWAQGMKKLFMKEILSGKTISFEDVYLVYNGEQNVLIYKDKFYKLYIKRPDLKWAIKKKGVKLNV